MTKTNKLRSDCPVNFGLESIGDKWSMLIIRDIVFWGKKTYGDFLRSNEGIATNILASRLAQLEEEGILKKTPDANDGRKDVYSLTEKGIELIPLLVEIVAWSGKQPEWQKAASGSAEQTKYVKRLALASDRRKVVKAMKDAVRKGSFFFAPK